MPPMETCAEAWSGVGLMRITPLLQSTAMQQRAGWMAAVAHRNLFELTLPGTHHSASSAISHASLSTSICRRNAQCQILSVSEQLHAGVRSFDVRIRLGSKCCALCRLLPEWLRLTLHAAVDSNAHIRRWRYQSLAFGARLCFNQVGASVREFGRYPSAADVFCRKQPNGSRPCFS